jgi:arylsulfatase A-like enzyme
MAHRPIVVSLAMLVLSGAAVRGPTELSASLTDPTSPPTRPNVVVLMVDDLDLVSFQAGLRAGFLPRLSRLFARGTRFRESFVSESLCCPSRTTYLTGLYPHNHGVIRNSGPLGGFEGFTRRFGENNLAVWMQAAGYQTAHVGKYLNGYVDPTFVPAGWDEWRGLVGPSAYCMYGFRISRNGSPVWYGRNAADYQTDVVARLADEVIAARGGQDPRPLFLNLSPSAPHGEAGCFDGIRPAARHESTPLLDLPMPPSFNEEDMSDKPGWMQKLPLVDEASMARLYNQRIASLRAVDDLLGRVVDALDANGELERTAFLFTSDNGYLLGRHRRKAKALVYEESIRVPLLVRVPGVDGPRVVDEITLNNDLAPTIAALAGATPWSVPDGRSLLPLLAPTPPRWRKRFLAALPPEPRHPSLDPLRAVRPFFAVRTGSDGNLSRLAYVETLSVYGAVVVDRELYDLDPRADPFQLESRHRDPAYFLKRQRLKEHLEALKTCRDGTCQTLEE